MTAILVVEDHQNLRQGITRILEESGYETVAVDSLQAAREHLSANIMLVVLDRMLPDGDGLNWLTDLRAAGNRIPILILTARDSIADRVAGLNNGADDYVVKPFSLDELLARIRALLRRDAHPTSASLAVGDLTVDLLTRAARRAQVTLELQNRQLELLIYLMRHPNQIVTREMISRDVWKESTTTWTNVIEVHVNQLRKQLERSGGPPILHTIRGQGYLLGDRP